MLANIIVPQNHLEQKIIHILFIWICHTSANVGTGMP